MKTIINTTNAPAPIGPYSQAVKANGFLFVSGQIALNPATGELVLDDVKTETKQVMENLKAILTEAGADFSSVIKTGIFLKDMNDFATVNEVYGSYFTDNFPARETVQVAALPKNVNVEISVVALVE
ncbi:RidA family protein [Mucilaginibacter roseus]|uniref:RidA family protein n=1 Tax=Mucilaginibacter roseus TaxID=1528868 RepID=A0ABS8U4H0_9SPHI|nr:RidA family protein [Mucilaginibacter roseus]MCD8740709.1 RidA family protein [Mucilaginibacter roseus]